LFGVRALWEVGELTDEEFTELSPYLGAGLGHLTQLPHQLELAQHARVAVQ
jgi:hypothetical protein